MNYFRAIYGPAFAMPGINTIIYHDKGALNVVNQNRERLVVLSELLANDSVLRFNQLLDVVAVDRPLVDHRFQILYLFLSPESELRLLARVNLAKDDALYSISSVFKSAPWLERECWDLFGTPFLNHPDLRRILTNYGFEGHPLRKEFPLVGYYQVRYDEEQKTVVEEPVTLTQEFRYFDFLSPWVDDSKDGDETKAL